MKKLTSFFLALLIVVVYGCTMCYANIANEELSLGGITLESSSDYVRGIYGEPDRIVKSNSRFTGPMQTYYYGTSFRLMMKNDKVEQLDSTGNNGIKTPSGICVGMTRSDLEATYGKPNKVNRNTAGYISNYYYGSENNFYTGAQFRFDGSGRISSISIGYFD